MICQCKWKNRNFSGIDVNFFVFWFFRLVRKTEKWKMDKISFLAINKIFLISRFILKLEKWKNDAFLLTHF